MPLKRLSLAATLFFALSSTLPSLRAADAAAGRTLVKRYADAIVSVELVVTLRIKSGDREAPPREQRIEVNGTVISENGLTVTTLSDVDPQATIEAMRAGGPGGRGAEIVGSEFKEVKLRLADGKEVPARFVLKDADLDLAFMAPDTSAENIGRKFAYVKLEDAAKGDLLDSYYFVGRAPKTLQRVPLVRETHVMGVMEKPRKLFLLTEQNVGTPVFDAQGKVLGVSVRYFANGRQAGVVVLPSEDIAEMAKQATVGQSKSPEAK